MKAAFRLCKAVLHLLRGYWIIQTRFAKLSNEQKAKCVQQWSAELVNILGVQLCILGEPMSSGLLVANHVSWLDNVAMHAAHYCRFVAKNEIKTWPLIGHLTVQSGMIFVERASRKDAYRVVQTVTQKLLAGDLVAVFPEGTTGEGRELLPFHHNLIQSAIDADSFVQPVAIRYRDSVSGQQSFAPCFVGDDTLLQSVWRTLSAECITVSVQFGAPQRGELRNRRTWANDLRTSLHTMLA